MAPLETPLLRKLLRFGAGAGIAAGESELEVCLARVRPGGAHLIDFLRIEDYRRRPASEWGAEYAAFLARHGAGHLAALVVLPRGEVIVRHLRLPGVSDQDAPAAIAFQLDALHPFEAEDVVYGFRRLGRTGSFAVAIAERRVIDFYTALLTEAGIRLAGFTFSGGAVFVSARLSPAGRPEGVLAVAGLAAGAPAPVEVYGESPSCPLFSASFDLPAERAAALAASELRLGPETAPVDLIDLLPRWDAAPDHLDLSDAGRSRLALPWAAALAAACPHLGAPVNLLPPHLRTVTSRAQYAPTAVLAALLLLAVGGLAAEQAWMDRQYLKALEAEAARLAPQVKLVESLDQKLAGATLRIEQLDEFRLRTKGHLDVVLELTGMLPPPAWLMSLQITPDAVTIWGESEQADTLLKKLDASPRFTASEFVMPLARTSSGEVFRIRTQREGAQR